MKRSAQIFLCYARQDEARVKTLYDKLECAGFAPWMDAVDLVGGEKWAATIQKIIPKLDLSSIRKKSALYGRLSQRYQ